MHRLYDAKLMVFVAVTGWLLGSPGLAQISQISSVLDGMGTRSTGGAYTHIGAGGQPGGIATNTAVGGLAPWFVVTNAAVDVTSMDAEFYAVEVLP